MGEDTLTMPQAWSLYDQLLSDPRVEFLSEPADLERHLRNLTKSPAAAPKLWTDAYLAAFADTAGIRVVTFEAAFASRDVDALILT
jgi:predicted nucleic acid-binding protein